MADLATWMFVILPFIVTAIVLLAWSALVLIQTPRPYWLDALNPALFGVMAFVALYFISRAIVRSGAPLPVGDYHTRYVLTLMGTFALLGAPRTFRQLVSAIRKRREEEL